jgi:hypothetical protein
MLHAKDLSVSIGAATLHVADPWIIDLNAPPSRGKREDGLIGADFFAKYVVRIDPEKQTIAFTNASELLAAHRRRGGSVLFAR